MHTTNYINTFIEIAEDCPVRKAVIPPDRNAEKSAVRMQYDLVSAHPYEYTSDDVLFMTYATRNGIDSENIDVQRKAFFSKGQACMRSSPLAKRYGWGINSDAEGKIALVPAGTPEYMALASDPRIIHKKAMKSTRG